MDALRDRERMSIPAFSSIFAGLGGRGDGRVALPIAPVIAFVAAAIVAIVFLIMPQSVLEGMVVDSGLASLITAAEPPLGWTARLSIAFFGGLGVGAMIWFGLFLLIGTRALSFGREADEDGVPVLRRADAHPDAPARRPVFANRDLGTPFLEVTADPEAQSMPVADNSWLAQPTDFERDLPKDLNTPLSAYLTPYDPTTDEDAPLPIAHAPAPVAPPPIRGEMPVPAAPEPRFAAHERIETFAFPPGEVSGEGPSTPLATATIHDLLQRLERGVERRQAVARAQPAEETSTAEPSLEDTLDALRRLASKVG